MKIEVHPPEIEIGAYSRRGLSTTEMREIELHLLRCGDCRGLMPEPKPEQIWASIFTERPQNEWKSVHTLRDGVSDFIDSFHLQLEWAALFSACLLLLALAGFSLLFFKESVSNETELALAPNTNELSSRQKIDITPFRHESSNTSRINVDGPFTEKDVLSGSRLAPSSSEKGRITKSPDRRSNLSKRNRVSDSGIDRTLATDVRGSSEDCRNQQPIAAGVKVLARGIELRWTAVPGAAKYVVYVSDFDERLIEEYETTDKTSYVVNAELDPVVTYRWKLLITLKDGRTLPGPSQNFTSRGLSENPTIDKKPGLTSRRSARRIRCAEKKINRYEPD